MPQYLSRTIIFIFVVYCITMNCNLALGQASRRSSSQQKNTTEKPSKQTTDTSSTTFSPSGKLTFEEFNPYAGSKDTTPVVGIGGIPFKKNQYVEKGVIIATDPNCNLILANTSKSNIYLGTDRKEVQLTFPPTPHYGIDNIYVYFVNPKTATKSSTYTSAYANNVSFDLIGFGASVEVVWYDELAQKQSKEPKIIGRKKFSAPFPESPVHVAIPDKITGFSIGPLNLCPVCNYGIDNITFGDVIPTDYQGWGLIFWHKVN